VNHDLPGRPRPASSARALGYVAVALLLAAVPARPTGKASSPAPRVILRELTFPAPAVALSADGRWSTVSLRDGELAEFAGEPEVPSLRVRLRLAPGETVRATTLEVAEEEVLPLARPLRPYGGERSTEDEQPPSAEPDPAIYASDALFPAEAAQPIASFSLSGGARFGVVRVHPLRVRPHSNELVVVRRALLRVEVMPADDTEGTPVLYERGSSPQGTLLIHTRGSSPQGTLLLHTGGAPARVAQAALNSPVHYVIITGDDPDMVTAWQRLADWKTATGDPALVVTTGWIRESYAQGADMAEKIRLFLRDAHTHWGLSAVLIGGDVEIVPTRMIGTAPFDVPSDYYYACLGGSWDANGNGIFGERPADAPDLLPEIRVGRVSARSAAQVEAFLEKYFTYVQAPPDDGYLDRGLMLGEVLFHAAWSRNGRGAGIPDCDSCSQDSCRVYQNEMVCVAWDGAQDCFATEEALAEAGYDHTLEFLLERSEFWAAHEPIHASEVESRESVLEHLSDGYNFVLHVGHGSWDRWAVGDGRLLVTDFPLLSNGEHDRFFMAYGVNCSSASIQLDSFGEQLVLLPGQGALAYIGSTYASSAGWAAEMAADFFYYLFAEEGGTLGDGFNGSAAANATSADRIIFGRALLGEPDMLVWRGTPGQMTVEMPGEVPLGTDSLEVVVRDASGGAGLSGARVCLQKQGEVYAVALTGADGGASLPFFPPTEGTFQVAVTTGAHRPETRTGNVTGTAAAAALRVAELAIADGTKPGTLGNANGRIERGEIVRLALSVENLGAATSAPVAAELRIVAAPAGLITLDDSTATLAAIAPGASESDDEAFLLSVDPTADDTQFGAADLITAELAVVLTHGTAQTTLATPITISRPRLELDINRWEAISADSAHLWVGLANAGQATASRLRCELVPAADDTASSSIVPGFIEVEDLEPGDLLSAGPFTVTRAAGAVGRLRLAVIDTAYTQVSPLHERTIETAGPGAPINPRATGQRKAVELHWDAPPYKPGPALAGYSVVRAAEEETTFVAAHTGLLRDHRYFLDEELADLTRYRYRILAVDEGGNPGGLSEIETVSTSPGLASGWPQQFLYGSQTAAPLICELDCVPGPEGCTHSREIFFGGDILQAYHGHGAEVADGDDNVITSGPFSQDPAGQAPKYEFRGKAAAADINSDGSVEVLAVSRQYTQLMCWDATGGEPRWTAPIFAGIAWRTPVLADLDGDGLSEVIVTGGEVLHEGIFVFKHDGAPFVAGTNGRLVDLGEGYLYHSPAVGDVNGDGALDIVVPGRMTGQLRAVTGATGEALPGLDGVTYSTWEPDQSGRGSPTLADVDGEPGEEIFFVTTGFLWSFDGQGALHWHVGFDVPFGTTSSTDIYPEPALGDIDGDGEIDLAVADPGGKLWARRALDGAVLWNFPVVLERGQSVKYGSCILANVDTDSLPEIIFGDSSGRIYAYTAAGEQARGFPIEFGGNFGKMSLAAWDVDGDGYQNLVVQAEGVQKLSVYDLLQTPFNPAENPWPMQHRDARNSGRYADPAQTVVIIQPSAQVTAQAAGQGLVDLRWHSRGASQLFEVRRWGPRAGELPGEMHWVGRVVGSVGGGPEPYTVVDTLATYGTYSYCINPVGLDGLEQPGASVELEWTETTASPFAFDWTRPNPALTGKAQQIMFHLPTSAGATVPVELRVFDVQGRLVRTLINEPVTTGPVTIEWQGRDDAGRPLATGLYILWLAAAGETASQRVLLVH
jgi:hypothetical protein